MAGKTVLVTGGCGFIGCNLVRLLMGKGARVVNIDKLTYAGNPASLRDLEGNAAYRFVRGDIADKALIDPLMAEVKPAVILNLAAESHVDRSIDGPAEFLHTNVTGTFILLEAARAYWGGLDETGRTAFRFLHVSTDEVYGSLGPEGFFTEETPYRPNSPYSASKASSDHLVRAWRHTYGLPTLITNCSNNYGPYQFPEKLIPLAIQRALSGEPIPVYGKGENVRDWLHVGDHAEALLAVAAKGRPGATYNIGGSSERKNIDLVRELCGVLDEMAPRPDGRSYADQITFVADRPGHDLRYAIDASKIGREIGWKPSRTFVEGLRDTARWYLDNQSWCAEVTDGKYRLERLGGAT